MGLVLCWSTHVSIASPPASTSPRCPKVSYRGPFSPLLNGPWSCLPACCEAIFFVHIASLATVFPFSSALCCGLECNFSSHCTVSSFSSFFCLFFWTKQTQQATSLVCFCARHSSLVCLLVPGRLWTTGKLAGRVNSIELKLGLWSWGSFFWKFGLFKLCILSRALRCQKETEMSIHLKCTCPVEGH